MGDYLPPGIDPPEKGIPKSWALGLLSRLKGVDSAVMNEGGSPMAVSYKANRINPFAAVKYLLQDYINAAEAAPATTGEKSAERQAKLDKKKALSKNLDDEKKNKMEEIFKQLDKDQSGFIDAAELKQMVEQLGGKITDDEAKQAVAECDDNGDGKISLEEFMAFWGTNSKLGGPKSVTMKFLKMKMGIADKLKKGSHGLVKKIARAGAEGGFTVNASLQITPDMEPIVPKMAAELTVKGKTYTGDSAVAITIRLRGKSEAAAGEVACALNEFKEELKVLIPDFSEMQEALGKLPTITQDKESVVILIEVAQDKVEDEDAPFAEMVGMVKENGAMLEEALNSLAMCLRVQFSSSFGDRVAEPTKMGSEFGPGAKVSLDINSKGDFADVLAFLHPSLPFIIKMLNSVNATFEVGYKPAKVSELVKKTVEDAKGADDDSDDDNYKRNAARSLEGSLAGLKAAYGKAKAKGEAKIKNPDKKKVYECMTALIKQVVEQLNGVESIDVCGSVIPFGAKVLFDDFDPFCVINYVLSESADAPSAFDKKDMDFEDCMSDTMMRLICLIPLVGLPISMMPDEEY